MFSENKVKEKISLKVQLKEEYNSSRTRNISKTKLVLGQVMRTRVAKRTTWLCWVSWSELVSSNYCGNRKKVSNNLNTTSWKTTTFHCTFCVKQLWGEVLAILGWKTWPFYSKKTTTFLKVAEPRERWCYRICFLKLGNEIWRSNVLNYLECIKKLSGLRNKLSNYDFSC